MVKSFGDQPKDVANQGRS